MTRSRIAILIATIIFAFSLMGTHLAVAKGEQKLSAQEHKLLASLNSKNTALFWQTVRKGIEILKSGGTKQEITAAVQAHLRTLSQDTGISMVQLGSLATNLMRDVEGDLQILREMLKAQKKFLQALQEYKARLESALARAKAHRGRFAEVEFADYMLTPDGQFMAVHTPHAHSELETDEAKFNAVITGHETHSFDAIQRELKDTRAQIRAVQETIRTIENEINQLLPLIRKKRKVLKKNLGNL